MYVMLLFMYYDLIKYIQYPAGQTLKGVVSGFLLGWILPQCAGAIGGCHIPVMPPILNHRQLNRKGWYSVILQAVVDHDYPETSMLDGLELCTVSINPRRKVAER